jgi:hypothetical protein
LQDGARNDGNEDDNGVENGTGRCGSGSSSGAEHAHRSRDGGPTAPFCVFQHCGNEHENDDENGTG